MRTFEQHLDDLTIISDESKQKVCIITDMVKLIKLNGGNLPNVEDFDCMYDMPIGELEQWQEQLHMVHHQKLMMIKMFTR